MADTATLTAMILECRRLSNQETTDQANALCTDAEIAARLNRNLRSVYRELIAARGAQYYRSSSTITTVAGTEAYNLPATMLQLIGLELVLSSTQRYPLAELNEAERVMWSNVTGQDPERYQIRGSTVALLPVPATVRTVNVYFVPSFIPLSAGADTFEGVLGFEELAIWRTVGEMLSKDESDPAYAMARAGEWVEHIRELADQRDAYRPGRVQRTRRQRTRWVMP